LFALQAIGDALYDDEPRNGGNWTLGVRQTGETKVVARANGVSDTNLLSDTGSSVKVGGVSSIMAGDDLTASIY